jgi:hypothetical protein
MSSPVPHRIRDIQHKDPSRRTPAERARLDGWDRSVCRERLAALEAALRELAVAMLLLPPTEPRPYHDPGQPVFSHECRVGRPAECHWYPCCNDVHPDARDAYAELARRLEVPLVLGIAS